MIDVSGIPKWEGKEEVIHTSGDTQDIVSVILETDKQDDDRFCKFASQFAGKQGLKKLYNFVKYDIRYRVDRNGTQDIKTPAALWAIGVGDCKSKTLFITQILRCLGVAYKIRFTCYNGGNKFTHVYPIAILNDGREVILDTVYHKYNKEKKYSKNKDYKNMTRIARISGISKMTSKNAEVKAMSLELEQKRSFIPQQEPLQLSKLSAGEANLHLLRRQAILLRGFNAESEDEKIYNKAVEMISRSIKEQKKSFGQKATFTGVIPNELQNLAAKIQKQSVNTSAAMSPKMAANNARIAATGVSLAQRFLNSNRTKYLLAEGTPYEVSAEDIAPAIVAWLIENRSSRVINKNTGQPLILRYHTTLGGTRYPLYAAWYSSSLGSNFQNFLDAASQNPNLVFSAISSGTPVSFNFTDNIHLNALGELEKYVEQHSGVWDKYLSQTVFAESGVVGAGLLYDFANRVEPINLFPNAVGIKANNQSNWMDSLAFFSGADRDVLQNMSRNTYVYGTGENPETTIQSLRDATAQNSIGVIDPVTITAIIGLVTTLIGAAVQTMQNSRAGADRIKPSQVPQTFVPLQESSLPSENDWLGGVTGGAAGGFDIKTALGLGLLAFGGYSLMKK